MQGAGYQTERRSCSHYLAVLHLIRCGCKDLLYVSTRQSCQAGTRAQERGVVTFAVRADKHGVRLQPSRERTQQSASAPMVVGVICQRRKRTSASQFAAPIIHARVPVVPPARPVVSVSKCSKRWCASGSSYRANPVSIIAARPPHSMIVSTRKGLGSTVSCRPAGGNQPPAPSIGGIMGW